MLYHYISMPVVHQLVILVLPCHAHSMIVLNKTFPALMFCVWRESVLSAVDSINCLLQLVPGLGALQRVMFCMCGPK